VTAVIWPSFMRMNVLGNTIRYDDGVANSEIILTINDSAISLSVRTSYLHFCHQNGLDTDLGDKGPAYSSTPRRGIV
jgi:hypothetical protein